MAVVGLIAGCLECIVAGEWLPGKHAARMFIPIF